MDLFTKPPRTVLCKRACHGYLQGWTERRWNHLFSGTPPTTSLLRAGRSVPISELSLICRDIGDEALLVGDHLHLAWHIT
jgi:hypothetical protein